MTKTTRPTDPREPLGAVAEPRAWLRERVRQHMLKMAPLALVAAVPLTNAACDAVPPPICTNSHDWYNYLSSQASWGEDHGNRIVLLDFRLSSTDLHLPTSYTIVGGSFLTTGKSDQLRIKPDAGAVVITLQGTMSCGGGYGGSYSNSISITIDLVPGDGGSADAAPMVKVGTRTPPCPGLMWGKGPHKG